MGMSLERDVLNEARSRGLRLSNAPTMGWLTPRGHLDPIVQRGAPGDGLGALHDVHRSLGGNRHALARGRGVALRLDLMIPSTGQLVEVNEVQHFTGARQASLRRYPPSFAAGFSIADYRTLIESWRVRAEAVFTRRWSPDFDFAGGRRAQRAYGDALVDLLAPVFTGAPVLRLAVPDGDIGRPVDHLMVRCC